MSQGLCCHTQIATVLSTVGESRKLNRVTWIYIQNSSPVQDNEESGNKNDG